MKGFGIMREDPEVMATLYVCRIYAYILLMTLCRDLSDRADADALFKKVLTFLPTVEQDIAFYAIHHDVATDVIKLVSFFIFVSDHHLDFLLSDRRKRERSTQRR